VGLGSSSSSPSLTPVLLRTGIPVEELRRTTSALPQFHPYTADSRLLCMATASRGGNDHAVPLFPFLLPLRVRRFLAVGWQRRRPTMATPLQRSTTSPEPRSTLPVPCP